MAIEFGVFDHLDRGAVPLGELYRNRLRLVEAYDAAGFYAYHLAEHHATSLGMAPSPGVFLSAVAQRTERLRLGPMVYVLPVHEPLRLIEEICMLDHLSGGRLELGFGRGSSPYELAYFGVDHLAARRRYDEAREIILKGLAEPILTYEGRFYTYLDVPMALQPVQTPHPPLWYGLVRPESAPWAAAHAINVVVNGPVAFAGPLIQRYRAEWAAVGAARPLPHLALSRHLYVGETATEAEETGRQAYESWYRSNAELWRRFGAEPLHFPRTYDDAIRLGTLVVGTPEAVGTRLAAQTAETGATYLMGRYAFGAMPIERALNSVRLFAAEVRPALTLAAAA
jgi:alkanesulfonate monooxygenase SsuD/methylene tetrahydromethanopterin reductase-like flavin-dependent oxidoreductase (luciferase family)